MPYAAATVTWVSQASFDPPLVMIALRQDSWTNEASRQSKVFALNILGKHQKNIAGKFFKEVRVEDHKINGFEYELGMTGSPLLKAAIGFIECRVVERVERGDHSVVIGEVIRAGVTNSEEQPILLRDTGWKYGG